METNDFIKLVDEVIEEKKKEMIKFSIVLNSAHKVFRCASRDIIASDIRRIQEGYDLSKKGVSQTIFKELYKLRQTVDENKHNIGNMLVLQYLINVAKSLYLFDIARELKDLKRKYELISI